MVELHSTFLPLTVKGVTIPNRIVCPPMNVNYASSDGFVTDRLIAFYRRIAEGGTGLVQVGACAISPDNLVTTNQIRADDDKYMDGLRNLFDGIRQNGSVASIQLTHAGKLIHSSKPAPKAKPFPPGTLLPVEPREWSKMDILAVEDAFAQAAYRVKEAGVDMLTIHGAHHYIINEFMSPYFNERTDEYGGSLENRVRFAIEVISKIRKVVGENFPVIFRISGADYLEGGLTLKDNKQIVPLLVKAGTDIIDVSAGGRYTYGTKDERTFLSKKSGKASNVFLATGIKEVVDVPVICVGNIWDMELAEEILTGGKADLVAIGRALIADPALVKKTREGASDSIARCTRCNKCLYFMHGEMSPSCPLNENL